MKKILIVWLLILLSQPGKACDICGCGTGSAFIGLLPGTTGTLFGVRSGFQSFNHPKTPLNFNAESQVLRDKFYRQEAWFRHFANPRLQFILQVPYQIHVREESLQQTVIQGIGDIQINALYQLFPRKLDAPEFSNWKHSLFIGGGVGLPTGKYQQRDMKQAMLPQLFQIGAGAFSGVARTMYIVKYKKLGLFTDVNHRRFAVNELDYHIGAQTAATALFFKEYVIKNTRLLPSAGLVLEHMNRDMEYGFTKATTGGTTGLMQLGFDFYAGKLMLQGFAQWSVLNKLPEAMPQSNWRTGITLIRAL
ncbi:MAG: hypothetical protein LAT76_04100 [Schleiferiaceae bacterium]|nr:hypothetical protein [Schleiferiaceae bacterium]